MASTVADKPTTVKELKAALEKLGVDYPEKAKKPELEELFAKATDSAPTGSSNDDAPEQASGEGPTDLTPDSATVPEDYNGPVLLKPLIHEGRPLEAGDPVPTNLTESDVERLQRLGVIAGGAPEPRTGFDVFEGTDGGFYWHLRAANGEIVAQGEGYSNRQAAERGVEAVKQAVADAD